MCVKKAGIYISFFFVTLPNLAKAITHRKRTTNGSWWPLIYEEKQGLFATYIKEGDFSFRVNLFIIVELDFC